MVKFSKPMSVVSMLVALTWCAAQAAAAPVSRLDVHIVTGGEELSAGSFLELRIYEAGKSVRRLPLVQSAQGWPRDSTRTISVKLSEPLDPRSVQRFAIFYRAGSLLAPPWEIVAADVDYATGTHNSERLLNATLQGAIAKQGELATVDRDPAALTCNADADCDDSRACNGHEHCAPRSPGADARGCVKGTPVVCPINQVCGEGVGCRGIDGAKHPPAQLPNAAQPQP